MQNTSALPSTKFFQIIFCLFMYLVLTLCLVQYFGTCGLCILFVCFVFYFICISLVCGLLLALQDLTSHDGSCENTIFKLLDTILQFYASQSTGIFCVVTKC